MNNPTSLTRAQNLHNWSQIISECQEAKARGTKVSAVIYSLVETAKANNLRTYEYLELLLTEIPNHLDDKNFDYFENLMPWSDYVKERCHTLKKS